MKIPGYCESCHKIKRVTVSNSGMVSLARGGVASGTCDECREKENDEAQRRNRPHR